MPTPIAPAPLARARLTLAASLCIAVLGAAAPAQAMLHYDGLAYAPDGQQLLYRESHWLRDDGARLVLYRCADGTAFARKRIADGSIAPDFELVDARSGYREGVRHAGKGRVMFSQRDGQPERSAPLPATAAPQVIDAGFDAFLRLHWDALGQGTPQRVSFVLPSALRTLDFQIKPAAVDAGVQRYTLAVDAWYGGVLPNIAVAYTRGDRRLLEFRGIGNVRDARGRYAQVRIEFPERLRGQADDDAWNQAVQQPLVAQCAAR
ncbi:hypothetical protein [Xanthomonas translucens]|uniref:hypothetical protein n=1 Tax=Xanthomonas campestris pv. translucens TaxID=343 RepID=UPI00071E82B8|nr:hypothetical protein [Xanthomonas translucens]KTF40749.1 hypothetical protein OZ12_05185 [Xanthomonas translucens pv. translucens]KWV16323.1 hypothetical protein ATB54_08495 [Xanthomonas translucens]MCS3359078.1 hypothetical protein [Xanthomonas translucens pv. translucens]MCS3372371.1 hypothetical protein [Xanthomonas translucens pv. translucens]MCT8276324.1 hypothetical protein [Xanthomonas translucens pv. translucens]